MRANEFIKHIRCETAKEFINAISPIGPYFESPSDVWIFRGHEDDENFKLIPSALRDNNRKELHRLAGSETIYEQCPELNISQYYAEAMIVFLFLMQADAAGLVLPEDSQELRSDLKMVMKELLDCKFYMIKSPIGKDYLENIWPQDELLSLIALAQHYGLPTRLLDWTRAPYTAAYFAARGACENKIIAVWALRAIELSLAFPFKTTTEDLQSQLCIITVPRAAIPNLHAQEGVFTLCVERDSSPANKVDRRPIDELFSKPPIEYAKESPFLLHFSLPSSEAGKVLWYLDKMGVNAAKLFPGYDGATRAIKERLYQQAPENP